MKYYPTQYQHTENFTNDASIQDVDLHHKYEPISSPKGRKNIAGVMPRVFIASRSPYKTGDVLTGTMDEFIALFGSRSNLNIYTRLAALKNRVKTDMLPEVEKVEEEVEGVIEDSLQTEPLSTDSLSYKGVRIDFKPVVNGVVFSSVEEAEKAIDMALQLKL